MKIPAARLGLAINRLFGQDRTGMFDRRDTDGTMDFAFSAVQKEWYEAAVRLGKEELVDPDAVEREARGEFWREGYARIARLGVLGLPVPTEYGGRGHDVATTVAAIEGLGYACPDTGLVFATGASLWTVTLPIVAFGSPAQKQRFLPGLCDGSVLGANAATEPDAGSDIFSMRTAARRIDGGWNLNGRKTWITSGGQADLVVCFASTDPSKGVLGITAFLVERGTPGFRVAQPLPTLGLRTAPLAELVLEECFVRDDAILGREGRGSSVFNAALDWERGAILAGVVGTMHRQVDRCIEHVRTRKQFGQSIGKFQSVANRIVEMQLRLETSRLLLYRYACARSGGEDAAIWASMAKLHVSECFVENSLDAVRILGAAGYKAGTGGAERDLRDSVGGVIFSGTNDIQRNLIAQHLRLG
jgi:alkylation response protein AidB-like acyl-CoA dehydrogenase